MYYLIYINTFTPFLVISILLKVLAASPVQEPTCFGSSGKPVSNFYPCDLQATISHCCGAADLCLSNGLCLNFGWDRLYQLQGCTDQDWKPPCLNQFRHPQDGNDRTDIWMCGIQDNKHSFYCTGTVGCCTNPGNYISIPNFQTIHRPLEPQVRIASHEGDDLQPPPENTDSTGLSSSDRIALGVGIPACLGVLVALCQWLYPGARIFRKKKADDDNDQHQGPPRAGDGRSSSQVGLDQELPEPFSDDPLPQPYSDSIGDLLESEDGWRDSSLDAGHNTNSGV